MNNNEEKKKEIVITGNTVLKIAGIIAGLAGVVYLITHLFVKDRSEFSWIVLLLSFGSCLACLALTRKFINN